MQVSHLCALSRLGSLESKGVFEDVTGIESIVNAGAGHWHSLAVSKKGNVYAWGSNKHMQLGVPATALEGGAKGAAKPQMLAALRDAGVKQVACGALHSMAVTRDGELYTWGYGKHGRLGHGDEEDQMLPKRVEALRGKLSVLLRTAHAKGLLPWACALHDEFRAEGTEAPVYIDLDAEE